MQLKRFKLGTIYALYVRKGEYMSTEKTYKGKEALIALINGIKLTLPEWDKNSYILITEEGRLYTESDILGVFSAISDYVEYQEPKKKKTYYKIYYYEHRNNGRIEETAWDSSVENIVGNSDMDIALIEEKEF